MFMKIAFVFDGVYPWIKGGADKRVFEIAKRLAKKHEVHWYSVGWWRDSDTRDFDYEGIHMHGVCDPIEFYVRGRRSIWEAIVFAAHLMPEFITEEFDVIDCQEFPYFPCFVAKTNSILKRSNLVITWYEVWDDYWYEYLGKKGFFGKVIERWSSKLPKIIIPISDKIKEDLSLLNVPAEKLKVAPNGVDYYRLQKIKPAKEKFDVIYVGRLISHKNVDYLIRSIKIVKSEFNDIRCGIIGSGPEIENLKNLSKNLNLEENIKFFGFVESDEQVYAYMKSSKLSVLPSTREGFPNTILEANACGLPVLIVHGEKNAGVGVVKNDLNGFILELSPEDIASKIIELLKNDDQLLTLKNNALKYAQNHDWDIIVDNIEKIYVEAIS